MAREKKQTELPMAQPGELQARLIGLREEAGYSIPQMADALCLSEEVVRNLEEENFASLAEPPYIRGYLRNYAKLGKEDSTELVSIYESLRGADVSELDFHMGSSLGSGLSSKKKISPVVAQLFFLALILLGLGGLTMVPAVNQWFKDSWNSLSTQFQAPTAESADNPDLIGTLPVPLPLLEDEEVTASSTQSNTAKNSELKVDAATADSQETDKKDLGDKPDEVTKEDKPTDENIEKNDKKESEQSEEVSTEPTPGGKIALKLVFNKDVWMRIRDKDKKTVYEGLNKSGTNKSLQFNKPITFRVGNAQGLSLFVDDKAVDISKYIDGSIANFTLE